MILPTPHKEIERIEQFTLPSVGVTEAVENGKIAPEKQAGAIQSKAPFGPFPTKDEALAYLADVLVGAYLEQKRHEQAEHTN